MNRILVANASPSVRTYGWRVAAIVFAVAVAVLLACYWQTVRSLVWIWGHDGTYQYAFLIFPLSCWTAFELRHRLRANAPTPSVWGLVAMAVLVGIWYIGHLFDVNLPQHFALVSMFPALVLACWGWRAVWVLKFPLGYLVFAVPWGNGMVGPLQDFTASFAVHALELTGSPVLLDGREIVTPVATWMVAQACSGVKFFAACTALGSLFAYLMYRHWWKRVLFVILSAMVPIIANGFRVYFTILIGETFGVKYASGTDHMVFGWQFFGTVLILLLLVGWFFRDRLVSRQNPPAGDNKFFGARVAVWPVALALLVAGPAFAAGLAPAMLPAQAVHVTAPVLADWTGPLPAAGPWRPVFKGAAGQVQVTYRSAAGGEMVELFHAVYTGKPRRGHDLITYDNSVYVRDDGRTRILTTASRHIDFTDGSSVTAKELRLAGRGGARLVWYWYCVADRCTASPVLTKLLQAWDILRGRNARSAVWALSLPITDGNRDKAREELFAFARTLPVVDAAKTRLGDDAAIAGDAP